MFDFTSSAAGIALIVSIASPIITTVLNNRFQLKLHRSKLIDERRLSIYENYLKYVSYASTKVNNSTEFTYYKSMIFLYAPVDLHDKIAELNTLAEKSHSSKEFSTLLSEVARGLSQEDKIC